MEEEAKSLLKEEFQFQKNKQTNTNIIFSLYEASKFHFWMTIGYYINPIYSNNLRFIYENYK